MSDSNMNANAKTEADENKKVAVDESQRPVMPDTDKNDAIPESQRPISPEEDKRRIRAMRGPKCIPDVLRQVLGEATKVSSAGKSKQRPVVVSEAAPQPAAKREGVISKLTLQRKEQTVCNYDRGWDVKPVDDETEIALEVLLQQYN